MIGVVRLYCALLSAFLIVYGMFEELHFAYTRTASAHVRPIASVSEESVSILTEDEVMIFIRS